MSNLLFTKHPIVVSQELAGALTELDPQKKPRISEAAVLQQINYWLQKKQNYHDGHYWVYNSLEEWTKQFTWIKTAKTMKRQFDWLEERGIVITGNYNKLKFDRTKWYTIDYDALDRLVSPFARNDQMGIVDTTKWEWSSQLNGNGRDDYDNTIDYTKTTTKTTQAASWPAGQSTAEPVKVENSVSSANSLRDNEGMNEVFHAWENAWNWPNGIIITDLTEWVHKYGSEIVLYAIKQAAEIVGLKKPSKYVASILDRYDREHLLTVEDIKADEQRHKQPQQNGRKQPPTDPDWQLIDHFS
ncbi:DnaD domain protein [Limosilactobacillus mucosae]|uniref:DnaD domain protein n=1 Tax=Limosilactobacillus mucosae TaxID=97478 RepID=UPI00399589F5